MTMAVRLPPVLLAVAVLHTAILPQFRVFDVAADLPVLLGVAAALAAGANRGAGVGFAAGLLADSFARTPFGLAALAYSLVGYTVGSLQSAVLRSSWWILALTAAVASAAAVALFAGMGAVVGQSQLLSARLPVMAAVVGLLNAALSPLAVPVLRWAVAADPVPRMAR
ncbi:MAG: rod shape-determining protein MreD [Acidimicrobiales bacterium]